MYNQTVQVSDTTDVAPAAVGVRVALPVASPPTGNEIIIDRFFYL